MFRRSFTPSFSIVSSYYYCSLCGCVVFLITTQYRNAIAISCCWWVEASTLWCQRYIVNAWMRSVSVLPVLQKNAYRYNSGTRTRVSWGATVGNCIPGIIIVGTCTVERLPMVSHSWWWLVSVHTIPIYVLHTVALVVSVSTSDLCTTYSSVWYVRLYLRYLHRNIAGIIIIVSTRTVARLPLVTLLTAA